jgi:predicted dehydrogenase
MPERLRCGVIGTGARGLQQLSSLLHCAQATAVAIAENHPKRAKEAADRYRLSRSYTRYQDLLDQPDVDAVLVAVPNDQHAQVVVDALTARKHVLLEPPLALQVKEAVRMIEVARKTKRVFMVAQGLRLNRQTQMARRVIERGDLGDIYHARCFWVRRAGIPRIGSWYTQRRFSGGGCLTDLGARILDASLFLLGDFEVRTVSATASARFGPRGLGESSNWAGGEIDPKRPFDVEDFGAAFLRLAGGRTVSLEAAWAAQVGGDLREQGIDLWGTKGGLSLFPARLYRSGEFGEETVNLNLPLTWEDEDPVHHFVRSVLEGRRPMVGLDESLKLQRIVAACYASAAAGKEIKLEG